MRMLFSFYIGLVGLCLSIAIPVGAKERRFPDIIAALHAADSEMTWPKREVLFRELEAYPINTCEEAKRLYAWLEEYPSRKSGKNGLRPGPDFAQSVANALSHTISSSCHELIANWLTTEVRSLPPEVLNAAFKQMATGESQIIRGKFQSLRIHALIHAAGDSKNEMALPTLRKMLKAGLYDYSADYAIGRIGKEEDLDWFVAELEKGDPKLRMRLQEFGPKAIRRIMHELENPAVPREKSQRLRHWIGGVVGRENVPLLIPLLQNKDPFIAKVAAKALEKNAAPEDESTLLAMLEHSNSEVRMSAVNTLARGDIWRFRYIERILKVLRSDQHARFAAAQAGGRLELCEAIPVLQEVIRTAHPNESWPSSHALEAINRSWSAFPSSPTGRKLDEFNQSLMDSWADPSSPDKDRYWAAQNLALAGERDKAVVLYREIIFKGSDDTARYKSLRDLWRMADTRAKSLLEEAANLPDAGATARYALSHWTDGCRGEVPPRGK